MKTRVVTALVAIPPVLLAVLLQTAWPIWVLASIASCVGTLELARLSGRPRHLPLLATLLSVGAAVLLVDPQSLPFSSHRALYLLFAIGLIGLPLSVQARASAWAVEVASLWCAVPLMLLVLAHHETAMAGLWRWDSPVLLVLLPLWAGDTAGLLIGKKWGKRLLAPNISPKKTVVGAWGNLFFCVTMALGLSFPLELPLELGLMCGLAAGLLGQAGDLYQSAWKRKVQVKDSGSLLPGHGGILDRLDSTYFAAPAILSLLEASGYFAR